MTEEVRKVVDYLRDQMCNDCVQRYRKDGSCTNRHPCRNKMFANAFLSVVADLEQVARERDAVINDMTEAGTAFMHCETCKKGKLKIECEMWTDEKGRNCCDYIWRGPCEENGGKR